jgi:hypothetical protein
MSLTFTPKILRYANLYFFIQNLSEWHVSTRKKHNEVWWAELSFSPEADLCIQEFKKIHEKYPFGDNYLGRPFFLYDDPWTQIEILVGKEIASNIKNIFATLEPYFDIIYTKDEPQLQEWAEIIKNPEFANKAFDLNKLLANFYGSRQYNEPCTIFLLLSTEGKNGGTAGTINNNAITLEVSRISTKSEKLEINILWHELIHLYFRNFVFYPLLKEYTNSNWKIMSQVDELVASALLPNGLLSQHALTTVADIETNRKFNARIDSNEIVQVQKLIYPYLQQEKPIDIKLAQELCAICNYKK